MPIPALRLYDRSRVEIDGTCRRKRYWQYEYKGNGIVPGGGENLELFLGTCLHEGLAALARGTDIETIVSLASQQVHAYLSQPMPGECSKEEQELVFAFEQATLVEGLLRGFHRAVWPKLIARYPKVLAVEEEMCLSHDGLGFMARPDLLLGDEETIIYVEYKSTSAKHERWINAWDTNVQLHSAVRAIEATKGWTVDQTVVIGLYKGYESYGKQTSPFCYGYGYAEHPLLSKGESLKYEYKPGMKRFPVWKLRGGVKQWVEEMPENLLVSQFPMTLPIMIKEKLIDSFFRQQAVREHEISLAMQMLAVASPGTQEALLDTAFPQRWDQCQPAWGGRVCAYKLLCHGCVDDPLEAGYIWRVPHHQLEQEQWTQRAIIEEGSGE